MKILLKSFLGISIFLFFIFFSFSSAEAASLKKYEDDFIRFSYPASWEVETQNIRGFFASDPAYYFIRIPQKLPYDQYASFMIRVEPTVKKIEDLKNKYPNNGYKLSGAQKITTKLSGLKAYRVVGNYTDVYKKAHRHISLWTVNDNDKNFIKEVAVEYDGTTSFYYKYVQDALKVMNSIKFK